MWFLLARLACMAISIGLWHRLSNSLPWACLNLFPLREVAKPGCVLGSLSLCKRCLCQGLVVHLWLRGLTWRVGLTLVQVGRSLLVVVSLSVLQFFRLVFFPITSNRFLLIWFRVTIFSLDHALPCSVTLGSSVWRWLAAHQPIIQKEVDELFSKGAIEPSLGIAGFYSSVFVVPKHTGGLWPILNLKWVNHYMHILKCLLSDMCGPLFSMVIMLSSLIYRMLIYIFLLLSITVIFYDLFVTTCFISGSFTFGLAIAHKVFTALTKPIMFFCHHKGLLSIRITSWSWFALSGQARGLICFCFPYWFALDCILVFPSLTFTSLASFVSWGYVVMLSICQYLYVLIN